MRNLIRGLLERLGLYKGPSPLTLPSPVSDNQYLAASANAGVVDNSTGAYDKYLFAENEIPEMPYETAVDSHLQLMSNRLEERFMRFASRTRRHVIRAQSAVNRQSLKLMHLESSKVELEKQLEGQVQVLNGERAGQHGLFWQGDTPVLVSSVAAYFKLLSRYALIAGIGAVDAFIIQRSFFSINIKFVESWVLTAPALAVQLVFPHILGTRLRLIVHGMSRKVAVWLELLVGALVWVAFIVVIANVRLFAMRDMLGNKWDSTLELIFMLLNIVLIGALGVWIAFMAIRENHHQNETLRLKVRLRNLEGALTRAKTRHERSERKLTIATEAQALLNAEREIAVESSRLELAEAAKSVYRRALINEMADPEFTKSYFQGGQGSNESES